MYKALNVGTGNTNVHSLLLMLSSPTTSIPNLLAVLRPFPQISGLTIDCHTIQALQETYIFKWQTELLPYLGIFFTPTLHTIYLKKYSHLKKNLSDDLSGK